MYDELNEEFSPQDISEEVMALLDSLDIVYHTLWEDESGDQILCLEENSNGVCVDIIFRQYPKDNYEALSEEEKQEYSDLDEVL